MKARSATAERARRFRKRQRRGLGVWQIEIHKHALPDALVAAGLVDPETATPEDYAAAAALVLADFTARFSATRYAKWLNSHSKAKQNEVG